MQDHDDRRAAAGSRGRSVLVLVGLGVAVIAVGFVTLIAVLNRHLSRLRRDFADLRAYLIASLGER